MGAVSNTSMGVSKLDLQLESSHAHITGYQTRTAPSYGNLPRTSILFHRLS